MVRFVILSQQRSGSRILMNLLNLHPHIYCKADLQLDNSNEKDDGRIYQEGFDHPDDSSLKALGFLLKIETNLYHSLANQKNLKIVYLARNSLLDNFLFSNIDEEKSSFDRSGKNKAFPIFVDPNEFSDFYDYWFEKHKEVRAALSGTDYLRVSYQDLIKMTQAQMNGITDYLEVERNKIKPSFLQKRRDLSQKKTSSFIANWEDLEEYFKLTPAKLFF